VVVGAAAAADGSEAIDDFRHGLYVGDGERATLLARAPCLPLLALSAVPGQESFFRETELELWSHNLEAANDR
jgi:hypothetical protein